MLLDLLILLSQNPLGMRTPLLVGPLPAVAMLSPMLHPRVLVQTFHYLMQLPQAISFVQVPKCWPENLCAGGKLFTVPDKMLKIKVIGLPTPLQSQIYSIENTVLNCEVTPLFGIKIPF